MVIADKRNNYVPSDDEEFMGQKQLEYFKEQLLNWKSELLNEIETLSEESKSMRTKYTADVNEAASIINALSMIEKNKLRNLKLIDKIEYSIKKIKNKTYGFCEKTGEQISIKRLLSRPIANLCIEAQTEYEKYNR